MNVPTIFVHAKPLLHRRGFCQSTAMHTTHGTPLSALTVGILSHLGPHVLLLGRVFVLCFHVTAIAICITIVVV